MIYPFSVALDSLSNIYIADFGANCIRKVTVSTDIITTFAGTGAYASTGDGGAATSAGVYFPSGIALDSSGTYIQVESSLSPLTHCILGNLYIAEYGGYRVRKVTVSTGIITTFAGSGNVGDTGDGGDATSATFQGPHGVAVDSSGTLSYLPSLIYLLKYPL